MLSKQFCHYKISQKNYFKHGTLDELEKGLTITNAIINNRFFKAFTAVSGSSYVKESCELPLHEKGGTFELISLL